MRATQRLELFLVANRTVGGRAHRNLRAVGAIAGSSAAKSAMAIAPIKWRKTSHVVARSSGLSAIGLVRAPSRSFRQLFPVIPPPGTGATQTASCG